MDSIRVPLIILAIFVSLGFATFAAESAAMLECKQLQEKRDKALAVAAEPINRRYQEMLEQVLRRAIQAGDLEAAVKLKQELESLQQPSKLIAGSVWVNSSGGKLTLNGNGTATTSWGLKGNWKSVAENKLFIHFEKDETWIIDPSFKFLTNPDGNKWNREK